MYHLRPSSKSRGPAAGSLALWLLLAFAACGPALGGSPRAPEAPVPAPPTADEAKASLIRAYPEQLDRFDGDLLVWRDGTRMPFDDGLGVKSPADRLERADIEEMFAQRYVAGPMTGVPAVEFDPGRARNAALFDKLYGRCDRGDVERQLVDVVWLPSKWGKTVKATRVNGVSKRLEEVSRDLDQLPASFDVYLFPPAGTYNCRRIAGTSRQSPHGYGIAIDLAAARANYWRWESPGDGGYRRYRNSIPMEIVAIFEKHGFIWGGKWYHFDTMHFEYRPELLGLSGRR